MAKCQLCNKMAIYQYKGRYACEEIGYHPPCIYDDCDCKKHTMSTNVLVKKWFTPWGKI